MQEQTKTRVERKQALAAIIGRAIAESGETDEGAIAEALILTFVGWTDFDRQCRMIERFIGSVQGQSHGG